MTGSTPPTTDSNPPQAGVAAAEPTLYVDLDGTLIQSDLLAECGVGLIKNHTASLWCLPGWLLQGRAALKHKLAERAMLHPAELPYRPEVLDYLREQKAKGRRLVLATAADQTAAQRVSEHLGLFEKNLTSDGHHNLKGGAKLEAIRRDVGEGEPFAYLGDSSADLPIWAQADQRLMAGGTPTLRRRVEADGRGAVSVLAEREPLPLPLLAAMRPRQWVKNGLLIVPMLAGHAVNAENLLSVFFGIVSFCFAASSIYLVNDALDVHADRTHPVKSRRPIAAGRLPITAALAAAPLLMGLALLCAAALLPGVFLGWLLTYLVLTLLYSVNLRGQMLIDVITLAGLYTLRVFAGGAAVGIVPSFWLLTLSVFLFLSLGFVKRYAELRNLADAETGGTGGIGGGRPGHDRGYLPEDRGLVQAMGVVSGYAAAIVLCLYLHDPTSQRHYASPELLWPTVPLFLYWVSRVWLIAQRGQMNEDPVAWAVGDRVSWVLVLSVMALALWASG